MMTIFGWPGPGEGVGGGGVGSGVGGGEGVWRTPGGNVGTGVGHGTGTAKYVSVKPFFSEAAMIFPKYVLGKFFVSDCMICHARSCIGWV